jgi:hypothetical protein
MIFSSHIGYAGLGEVIGAVKPNLVISVVD